MDDTYRKEINSIYRKRTSEKDKKSNAWDFTLSVGIEFLSKFIGAFLITAAMVMAPGWFAVGTLAVLAVGCVVLPGVPEQSVPSWLQGAKDIADRMAQVSVRALDEGPLVFVEAIGQGIADQVQTPQGIAALAGEVTGGVAGGYAGVKWKSYLAKKKLNVDKTADIDEPDMPKDTDIDELDVPKTEDVDVSATNVDVEGGKKTITSTLGNEIDVTPSSNHTSVNKNPGPFGEANSSVDILDADGNIKTRRWYDSNGKAYRDVDMSDHGNPKEHPEVPHEHTWEYNNGKPKRK